MRVTALVLLLALPAAAADSDKPTVFGFDTSIECKVPGDPPKTVTLPPGVIMPQAVFDSVDAEVARLQDQEIRLKAQNSELGTLLAERPHGMGFRGAAIILGIGIVLGVAATVGVVALTHR